MNNSGVLHLKIENLLLNINLHLNQLFALSKNRSNKTYTLHLNCRREYFMALYPNGRNFTNVVNELNMKFIQ